MINKTKPTGIRFDLEQLNFFKSENPNLTTPQQIVNYLLDSYFTEHKIIPELIRKNPMMAQKEKVANYSQPLTKESEKPKIRRSFDNYQELVLDCTDYEEYAKLYTEIENSDLTPKQKNLLLKR